MIVHSTLAKRVYYTRKVIASRINITTTKLQNHTRHKESKIKIGPRDARMPSLENWGGGLKSLAVYLA